MAKHRVVRVMKPIVPDPDRPGMWLAYDEAREHEDHFTPDKHMREVMGGRPYAYFWAVWSAEGWKFGRRIAKNYFW